jgi:hypothetical protein
MKSSNRIAKFARAFTLFTLIAVFAAAAFPSASHASSARKTKNPPATGKVVILVLDHNDSKPIEGAELIFRRSGSVVVVAKGITDAEGYFKAELPAAVYDVEVSAHNYKSSTEVLNVAAGVSTVVKLALYPDNTSSTPPPPVPFTY